MVSGWLEINDKYCGLEQILFSAPLSRQIMVAFSTGI
jgi:hypothetical protein